MPKVEFMLQLFMVVVGALVVFFAMPFVLLFGGGTAEEAGATGSRFVIPGAEALWGGVAVGACILYAVGTQGTSLVAVATGIGMALGVLPAA